MPAIGATGGSLAFACSNTNGPSSGTGVTYDGLTGGYLGLGIDEYGNFLNAAPTRMAASRTTATTPASGYGFKAGRIGLRGAGAISWPALNNAYGANPNSTSKPYYPATLSATCTTGTLDSVSNTCGVCPTINPTSVTSGNTTTATTTSTLYTNGMCQNTTTTTVTNVSDSGCTSGGYTLQTLNGGPNNLQQICEKCSSGTYSANADTANPNGVCWKTPTQTTPSLVCPTNFTYDTTLSLCVRQSVLATNTNFSTTSSNSSSTSVTNTTPTSTSAYTPNTSAIQTAIQRTCATGHLWNYSAGGPYDAGPAALSNTSNTAGILDYPAIPAAYTVLPSQQSAVQRRRDDPQCRDHHLLQPEDHQSTAT